MAPGDRVDLDLQPSGNTIYLFISVYYPDGSSSGSWTKIYRAKNLKYDSMECIAEAPFLVGGKVARLADFGTAQFNGCKAIEDYASGTTLYKINMQTNASPAIVKAVHCPISVNQNGFSTFAVAWNHQ